MNLKNLAMWAIIVFLTIGLYNMFKNPQPNVRGGNQIIFSDFLTSVDKGEVLKVESDQYASLIGGKNITLSDIGSATGTYDSFNPFILKGTSAAGIYGLFESLTTGSSDEAFTEYGLLAEKIEWPKDRSWVTYTIRDYAHWHDGKKITADDVIWTFNTLMEKGHPFYKYYYGDVSEVIKISENKVKFTFSTNTNKELQLPNKSS